MDKKCPVAPVSRMAVEMDDGGEGPKLVECVEVWATAGLVVFNGAVVGELASEGGPRNHSGSFSLLVVLEMGGGFQRRGRSRWLDWMRLQPPKRFIRVASSRWLGARLLQVLESWR